MLVASQPAGKVELGDAHRIGAAVKLNSIARRKNISRDVESVIAPVRNKNTFAAQVGRLNGRALRNDYKIAHAVNANSNAAVARQENVAALPDEIVKAQNVQTGRRRFFAREVFCVRESATARVDCPIKKIFRAGMFAPCARISFSLNGGLTWRRAQTEENYNSEERTT